MSSINVKQVFSDLEKVVGVNAVLYQCARYMNEKGIPYAIPPSTWLEPPITPRDNSPCEPLLPQWSNLINSPVEPERRVRKGWGAPSARKKIRPTPESLDSVVRKLDFSDEDIWRIRLSVIQ